MSDADRERLIKILKLGSCPSPYLCDENCKYANLERCYEERTEVTTMRDIEFRGKQTDNGEWVYGVPTKMVVAKWLWWKTYSSVKNIIAVVQIACMLMKIP